MSKHQWRVIDTCPCPKLIAPYIYMVTEPIHAECASIFRGDSARALLNKYGHHSQYQLYHATPAERSAWGILGTPDKPGQSTHELKSDGVAYRIPVGGDLDWWMQGFDVPTALSTAVIAQASAHGWQLFRPYSSGVEIHHLNFAHEPKPKNAFETARIIKLRATLPRS